MTIAWNASQTKTIRDSSGMSSPALAVGIAEPVPALVARAHDRPDVGQPLDRRQDLLAELRMPLDDLELLVGQRPRLAQDLRGHADLADVVEERTELEPLHRLAVELQLTADEQRDVGDPAGMRRGVLVVRLERVRERRHRRDERALERCEVLGALDRELRLVSEAARSRGVPVVERAVGRPSPTRARGRDSGSSLIGATTAADLRDASSARARTARCASHASASGQESAAARILAG